VTPAAAPRPAPLAALLDAASAQLLRLADVIAERLPKGSPG